MALWCCIIFKFAGARRPRHGAAGHRSLKRNGLRVTTRYSAPRSPRTATRSLAAYQECNVASQGTVSSTHCRHVVFVDGARFQGDLCTAACLQVFGRTSTDARGS